MNQENLNNALYDKMAAEQDTYRSWLLGQTPEEILNHTYEYTVREDILMAMEEMDLPRQQAEALLSSPSPLSDVYKHFTNLETEHMDVIRASIEDRAKDTLDSQQEATRAVPVYRQSLKYAREHNETDLWKASHQTNIACRDAIETAIREGFDGMHLSGDAAKEVLAAFSPERVTHVLAATIQEKDWDQRFSSRNRAWAQAVPVPENGRRDEYIVNSHPAVLDGFVSLARKELEAVREQPEQKPSIKAQLAVKPVQASQTAPPRDKEAR